MAVKIEIPVEELRKRSLFVATPMYGGQCSGPYMKSCLDLQSLCHKYGVPIVFYFLFNESLITRARNYLADEFLRSNCTHLMFIDSDIDFKAMDVMALLAFDKPINGGPYPKKTIAWEKIYDAVKMGMVDDNPNKLEAFVGDYVFNVVPGTKEIKLDQPCQVLELGTGFMMVKRDVFPKFQAAYPELLFRPDHNRTAQFDGSREICAFFDTVIDKRKDLDTGEWVGTKRYLSEDYMFCQYARKIGIEVWMCPWFELKHLGTYVFGGSLTALANLSNAQSAAGHATPIMKNLTDTLPPKEEVKPAEPVVV
jgi:hypothetical protein